jgi:hypothetical protein
MPFSSSWLKIVCFLRRFYMEKQTRPLSSSHGLLPDGAIVEGGGDRKQQVSQEINNEPDH